MPRVASYFDWIMSIHITNKIGTLRLHKTIKHTRDSIVHNPRECMRQL